MSGIIRVSKRPERYTITDNEIINDSAMTWEARGLLIYLLSKPNNWHMRLEDLVKHSPAGIKVVRRIVKELEILRYIFRFKYQDKGGKWVWESVVFEWPYNEIDIDGIVKPYTRLGYTVYPHTPKGKTEPVRPNRGGLTNTDDILLTSTTTGNLEDVYKLWQNNIGMLEPILSEKLALDYEDYGYEWIEYAITECVTAGVRNYKYFAGILARMKTDGGKREKPKQKAKKIAKGSSKNAKSNAQQQFDPDIFKTIQEQVAAMGD